MKEPTEAQVKEFWEWCGVKYQYYSFSLKTNRKVTDAGWIFPGGEFHFNLPPIDLNNLFKYAMPKLDILRINLYPASKDRWGCYFDDWYQDYNLGETPALALFWAIWEVINKS